MLLLAGVFGVLLPVPMAFDVVVCSVLLGAGMPVQVVAVLLVTLGTYSVYAWSLLGTTLSWRVGSLAAAAILVTGVLTGAVAGVVDHWNDLHQARRTAALAGLPARPLAGARASGGEERGRAQGAGASLGRRPSGVLRRPPRAVGRALRGQRHAG